MKIAAALLVLGSLGTPWNTFPELEHEPNDTLSSATRTGTLPTWPPHLCVGRSSTRDIDLWRIELDYETTGFVEGRARFRLDSQAPAVLSLFNASPGGYFKIGTWAGSAIDTGAVQVTYYHQGWDHVIARVQLLAGEPVSYALRYK